MPGVDLDCGLRWIARRRGARARRPDEALAFLGPDERPEGPILLDTCVYIDRIRRVAPGPVLALLEPRGRVLYYRRG